MMNWLSFSRVVVVVVGGSGGSGGLVGCVGGDDSDESDRLVYFLSSCLLFSFFSCLNSFPYNNTSFCLSRLLYLLSNEPQPFNLNPQCLEIPLLVRLRVQI
jgi:hypothetical protein